MGNNDFMKYISSKLFIKNKFWERKQFFKLCCGVSKNNANINLGFNIVQAILNAQRQLNIDKIWKFDQKNFINLYITCYCYAKKVLLFKKCKLSDIRLFKYRCFLSIQTEVFTYCCFIMILMQFWIFECLKQFWMEKNKK